MAAILIIDDNSISRQVLVAIIGSIAKDREIIDFTCAQEALSWAESNPVALVLTDYRMPKMNGIEFLRVSSGNKEGSQVK